ncbi:MAG: hypothetical protein PVJ19_12645 [Desulfobacteraceae bacterium]
MKSLLGRFFSCIIPVWMVTVLLWAGVQPAFAGKKHPFCFPAVDHRWHVRAPTLEDLQALDRTDFQVLYPGVYTDYEKAAVEQYLADNAAIKERGPVDVHELVDNFDAYKENTPGIGVVIDATEAWVRYQNDKYDPYNPIRWDSDYAKSIGYEDILAYISFGAHDDTLMIPWPTDIRDKLLVSDLNHSITAYAPIYPGDTLYLVADEREILDLTPPQGSTYRSIAIQSKGSLYNQRYEKVCDLIFRVTEALSIYADDSMRPEDPGFFDYWEAPDWSSREEHYYTEEDWSFIKQVWEQEKIRGSEPLYWEDVNIGDMPTWTLEGPIYEGNSPTVPWGMGVGGSRSIKTEILTGKNLDGEDVELYRSETDGIYYLSPDANAQVPTPPGEADPSPLHGDAGERDRGAPLTNFTGRDFAIRHITNWMGDYGRLYNISWSIMDPRSHWKYGKYVVKNPRAVRYLNQVPHMKHKFVNEHGLVKDIALVKSYVTEKKVRDGKFEVKLIWWIETIEGDIWEEGAATVQLPSKNVNNN